MLIEFKFSNYRSFRDEAVLSMEATGLGAFKNSLFEYSPKGKPTNNPMRLIPAAAIYGKNGGGKSNVIRAFWFAVQFIKTAQRTQHEKALVPVLPSEEEFPYAIRTVSETFESNGSTSQASICASTMSLMAAGVPIKSAVAGISAGLVTGETDDDYLVLTDIQGLEDFFGDMDFKVAGTHEGITAIQMDIKIHGLTRPIIEEAIAATKKARTYIMDEVMSKAIAEPRKEVGEFAPKIIQMQIDPQKIGDVVGQRGKTINAIIDETGVKIDIDDEGNVSICGTEKENMEKAAKYIQTIVTDYEAGQLFEGKVISIKEFGAFVEFAPGKEGMVHISKLSKQRVDKVEDVVSIGDVVKVVCLGKDKMGRFSFSMKDVAE